MGRLISFDYVVEEKINTIFKEKNAQCGLIIGQVVQYAVFMFIFLEYLFLYT